MPSTYTDNLGIELPANGELDGVWGDVVNENMEILDRAINGSLSLSLSGTSSTLTTSNGALSDGQYKLLVLTGSPSGTHTITISPNDAQKIYFVRNTTAQSVVFTQGSGGNVTIATGDSGIIYANGAGAGAAVANLTDHFAMSSVNITGGSITGLADLSLSAANPSITFAETDTTDTDARLRLNAGDLLFETVTDAGVQVRENMRIESGGNVGIGTDSPQTALEVSSTTNPTATFIAYISGTTMTVTGITSGALAVGDRVFGAGVEWNTVITAQTSGTTGASGNYTVNNSQTVSTAPTGIAMDSGNAGKSVLRLTNTDTTESANQTTGGIEFYGSDATAGAGVKGYVALIAEDNSPSSALLFGTSADTSTAVAVERMRIDSAGNVGIGTKSPAVALDVVGAGKFSGGLTVDTSTLFVDATNDRIGINTTSPQVSAHFVTTAATTNTVVDVLRVDRQSSGTPAVGIGVGIEFAVETAAGNTEIGAIIEAVTTDVTNASEDFDIVFKTMAAGAQATQVMRMTSTGQASFGDGTAAAPSITNTSDLDTGILFPAANTVAVTTGGSERMRVNSAGTVLFCGSTTSGVFDGDGVNVASTGEVSINVTAGSPLDINQSTNDNVARSMIRFYRREIQNGSITTSSTATAYVTSSDYRLKENIQPMTGALGVVAQLNPVTYTWKTDGSDGQGFIAHELQEVVPDCVIGEKDAVDADGKPEYQGVDTSFLVATLTAAIQEQQALITALTARVSALENTAN